MNIKNYQFIRSTLYLSVVFVEIQYFSSFSMIIKVFPLTKSWQNLVSFYVGANALILQVIVKRLFCSFSFQIHMERDVVYGHRRFQAGGWQSITLPWMKERGWTPLCPPLLWIFTKSLLRRLLTWNMQVILDHLQILVIFF